MPTHPRRGDRIIITGAMPDPDPLPIGSTGMVRSVTTGPLAQIRRGLGQRADVNAGAVRPV